MIGARQEKAPVEIRTLAQLKPGRHGVVSAIRGNGALQQRLLEMGIIEGVRIEVVRLAPLGDPMEVQLHGYHLSLRKTEAALVELEP